MRGGLPHGEPTGEPTGERSASPRTEAIPGQLYSGRARQSISTSARGSSSKRSLLILMHMCSGQAARTTEIMSIRHQNTSNGGIRNVFIDRGMVLFVTAYHKGYEFSEHTKIV